VKISRVIKVLIGITIAALCLYIFLKDVDIHNLFTELKSVKITPLIVMCLLIIATLYLRSLRWKFMLPDIPGTSKKYLFSNVMIGFMINNILPARIGEFARSFILWKKNRFPLAISLGTLIVERIIDTLIFSIFFIIPVFVLPQCSSLTIYAFVFTGIIIICIVCVLLYFRFQSTSIKFATWIISKLPEKVRGRTLQICKELASTLNWLKSPKRAFITICLSFLTLLCYPAMIIVLAGDAGIPFGLLEGMFAQAFAAFGAAIPLAPGYVGTLHAIMLQGLEILGMNADKARALIIIYHAVNYILITVLGIYFFFRMKLSIKEISMAKKEMA
jgi:uncharacterized protein (TIRG00374 family)